jgi:ABC-type uncharacterized transport system substrate-binding protein
MTTRRAFMTALGGAASWPAVVRAQQPAMPVIGFLHPTSPDPHADRMYAFRRGLKNTGYIEGENVAIEYRWAEGQLDRLPVLAAELVLRKVAVVTTIGGATPAFAAKAATTTIPIVFVVAEDPVRLGLVASLARPGGNLTGINFFSGELGAKQFGLLRELVPGAVRMGVLVNPANPRPTEMLVPEVEAAARTMGCKSKSSTPAPDAKSTRLLQRSRASAPTPSSSSATPISPSGGCSLQTWRRVMRFPHRMSRVTFPKPVV